MMYCSIMLYKIQNNECSTELEYDNQDTSSLVTTDDTLTGLKKLLLKMLIFCCFPLTLIIFLLLTYLDASIFCNIHIQVGFHPYYLKRI